MSDKPLADVILTLSDEAGHIVEGMAEGAYHFFEEHGEVPPAVACYRDELEVPMVFKAQHANDTEKACVWAFLRFLRETHPIVVLISEVWINSVGKDKNWQDEPRPSEHPNRQQKVMINVWERNRTVMIAADIYRNPNKLGPFLGRMDTIGGDFSFGGALADGKGFTDGQFVKRKEPYGR